jgi:hypothetical protein
VVQVVQVLPVEQERVYIQPVAVVVQVVSVLTSTEVLESIQI